MLTPAFLSSPVNYSVIPPYTEFTVGRSAFGSRPYGYQVDSFGALSDTSWGSSSTATWLIFICSGQNGGTATFRGSNNARWDGAETVRINLREFDSGNIIVNQNLIWSGVQYTLPSNNAVLYDALRVRNNQTIRIEIVVIN